MGIRQHSWFAIGKAWLALCRYDLRMRTAGFKTCYESLQAVPLGPRPASADDEKTRWVSALDSASALYWKRPLCLQRSLVLAALLRRAGIEARVVFGMRRMSTEGHAWVDVDGAILSDMEVSPNDYLLFDRI